MIDKNPSNNRPEVGLFDPEESIEVEILNPEEVTVTTDDMELTIEPEEVEEDFARNLAEDLSDTELAQLASDLLAEVQGDKDSRAEWITLYAEGLDLLGLDIEERSEPWQGACGLQHPMLLEAAIRFQSETITETFPAAGPVKAKIIGKETPEKKEAAKRVTEDMNYRLTEQMSEYRTEHEKMLFNLALAGSAFKKVYFDPSMRRQASVFVPAEDFIMPYGASNVSQAHRKTHVMRKTDNEVRRLQIEGFYRDVEIPEPTMELDEIQEKKAQKMGVDMIVDERHTLYEIHCELDLPGFEDKRQIKLPYVVTIEKSSGLVLSIYRNWLEEDEIKLPRSYFVGYNYVTGFGAYGFGLIHIVGALAKGGTSILRQLVDSGTLANLPGGLKSRGLRIKGDDTPIGPGEFRDVDIPSGSVKDNIMMLPYKEPSQVLFQLYQNVVDEGRRLAATADLKVSDMSANAPVGTTLALLERQLKTMGAIQARVHNSMKEEFKLLKLVIRDHVAEAYEYEVEDAQPTAMQADYDMVEVIPVSDPNAATMSQRIAQLQAVQQLSVTAPNVYDMAQLHRSAVEMIGFPNADKIVPLPDDMTRTPKDPVSENMAVMISKPVKAFIYQDHRAHIATHQAFMQDPSMAPILNSPQGAMIGGALMAHIQEHMAMEYRNMIQAMLGIQLPNPDDELDEQSETMLSQVMAQAGQQLLQQNMQAAQAQQAQQMAQDPVIQQQDRELRIKEMETQRKAMNDNFDREVAMERLALERERLAREDARQTKKIDSDNLKAAADLQLRAGESRRNAAESAVKMEQAKQQASQGGEQ